MVHQIKNIQLKIVTYAELWWVVDHQIPYVNNEIYQESDQIGMTEP